MNITSNPFASIQSSISSAVHSITDGAEQVQAVQSAQINTALDSFQSVQSESNFSTSQAPSAFSEVGSFADPLSFYRQQNPESGVVQFLKNPNFQALPNLKSLATDIGAMSESFVSSGTNAAVTSSLANNNFRVPSEIDLKSKELRDQLTGKKEELQDLRNQIREKMEEIEKKQAEQMSGPNWSTGVEVADDILGEVLGEKLGPKPDPSELHRLEREVEELQARAGKVMDEIQALTKQMEQLEERKREMERGFDSEPLSKAQQKIVVDPFLASIETQPDQTMLNFSRAIHQQLDYQLFPQRSLLIRA